MQLLGHIYRWVVAVCLMCTCNISQIPMGGHWFFSFSWPSQQNRTCCQIHRVLPQKPQTKSILVVFIWSIMQNGWATALFYAISYFFNSVLSHDAFSSFGVIILQVKSLTQQKLSKCTQRPLQMPARAISLVLTLPHYHLTSKPQAWTSFNTYLWRRFCAVSFIDHSFSPCLLKLTFLCLLSFQPMTRRRIQQQTVVSGGGSSTSTTTSSGNSSSGSMQQQQHQQNKPPPLFSQSSSNTNASRDNVQTPQGSVSLISSLPCPHCQVSLILLWSYSLQSGNVPALRRSSRLFMNASSSVKVQYIYLYFLLSVFDIEAKFIVFSLLH